LRQRSFGRPGRGHPRAAAAYQGSFWKLSLRLGRWLRGAAFAVFCCSLFRFGINASSRDATVRPEIRA
jgi:hypothetical protein